MSLYLAPMMGYTHGWFRSMIQAVHPKVQVMSEMITLQSLKYCPNHMSLWIHPLETNPILQVAASSVQIVSEVLEKLDELKFTHINLNAGCPSSTVGQGCMGATMIKYPSQTRDVLKELMKSNKHISIKTRLGVDDMTDSDWDAWFDTVLESGVSEVYIHARIALLNGLNPSQNRSIPPLRYDRALELANKHPQLSWVLNGGLNEFDPINHYRFHNDLSGVMLGRIAYQNPMLFWRLAQMDGVADFSNIEKWFESVDEGVLCFRKIAALLPLTKGLVGAKGLRDDIASHRDKKYDSKHLLSKLYELYVEKVDEQIFT